MLWNWLCLGVFQSPETSLCGLFLNGFKMATFMREYMLCLLFIMIQYATADIDCSSTETLSNPVHVTCDVCKFGVIIMMHGWQAIESTLKIWCLGDSSPFS